mgnify:CR=1 FL=1
MKVGRPVRCPHTPTNPKSFMGVLVYFSCSRSRETLVTSDAARFYAPKSHDFGYAGGISRATPHFPCKLRIAITLDSHILITMKTAVKKKVSAPRRRSISKKEISARLADLDLAQTSAIRDLEMDINGEDGIDSTQVLAAARKALA